MIGSPRNNNPTATMIPRLRAACDWSARLISWPEKTRSTWPTVRHILDYQAKDDDGGGRHGRQSKTGKTDKPRWRALQQLLL